MADQIRIAFVGGRGGAHSTSFDAFVPPEIALDTVRLSPRAESPADSRQAEDAYVADVVALLREHRWNGAALVGTPTHVRFPNALAHIREALDLPVTSPLEAGVDALHALEVRRALLLSPFAPSLNQSIGDYLAADGIDLVLPATHFASTDAAGRAGPEEVRAIVRKELASATGVQAVFFQGARLDPLAALDSLEQEIGIPLVASNPSMFWHVLAMLGRSCHIEGCGRLLREWPAPRVRP